MNSFQTNPEAKRVRVEYAVTANGRCPARDFIRGLGPQDRKKIERLIARLEQTGSIPNREKFKRLDREANLYEFKAHQVRLFGDFRPGGRFVVASGTVKKGEWYSSELEVARRILAEYDRVTG